MFEWFYRRIANGVIVAFEEWLQQPENIAEIAKLADALVDREMKRIIGSIGGSQKGLVTASTEGIDLGSLLTSRGGISSKKILGALLNKFLSGGKQSSSSLP